MEARGGGWHSQAARERQPRTAPRGHGAGIPRGPDWRGRMQRSCTAGGITEAGIAGGLRIERALCSVDVVALEECVHHGVVALCRAALAAPGRHGAGLTTVPYCYTLLPTIPYCGGAALRTVLRGADAAESLRLPPTGGSLNWCRSFGSKLHVVPRQGCDGEGGALL